MQLFRSTLLLFIALFCLTQSSQAQSQPIPLAGTLENYFVAGQSANGSYSRHQVRYLTLHGELAPSVRYVAGELNYGGYDLLDENYLAVDRGEQQWRVGRFRSAFGFSDWAEGYYAGFIQFPLLRSVMLEPGLALPRLDTGVDWQGGAGALVYQVGVVDVGSQLYQALPRHADHFVGRLQTYHGNWIFGFNLLAGNTGGKQAQLADLDWRWSAPHVQMRGEYLVAPTGIMHPQGGYVDFFYHPPVLTRTTFLARAEAVSAVYTDYGEAGQGKLEQQFARRYTIGVKQILSPLFTLELNRSWGNDTELTSQGAGWNAQVITFTRF